MIRTDFHVEPASWSADEADLRAVREQVFIVEQRIPEAEEWDDLDARSHHVIARDADGRPIGTGRLTPDFKIGRMAVIADWRGRGVGEALMRTLIERARELRYPTLDLHAQTHAIPFYGKFGFAAYGDEFMECDIPHRMMRLELATLASERPPAKLPERPEARVLAAEDRDQAAAAAIELIGLARRELVVYTRDLDPLLLDNVPALEAIKRIALAGRGAQVRIIVQEPQRVVAQGHRLVALAQRLPTSIAIRKPADETDLQYPSAFLLNDRRGYLFRALASRYEGDARTYDPGRHAQLLEYFNRVWERSAPSEELRQLAL